MTLLKRKRKERDLVPVPIEEVLAFFKAKAARMGASSVEVNNLTLSAQNGGDHGLLYIWPDWKERYRD